MKIIQISVHSVTEPDNVIELGYAMLLTQCMRFGLSAYASFLRAGISHNRATSPHYDIVG